jgi:hypothetical protein
MYSFLYRKSNNCILSDQLFFEENGQYLRYLSDRTTFTIQFLEESYFLQNNQKPMIRLTAMTFHTLLFISLIIQSFPSVFLLFKINDLSMITTIDNNETLV